MNFPSKLDSERGFASLMLGTRFLNKSSPKWWLFMVMNPMGSQSVYKHQKQIQGNKMKPKEAGSRSENVLQKRKRY